MSQSATPATHNDMTTCMETFEKERFCSFPQRHGDATGKPETRDETNGHSKTSISCETSSNFDTFDTLSNRLECHKVPRLPRTTAWQPAWKPSKRRGFAASPKDTATPQENQRLETRQMGAAKRAFRARLPPILTLLTRYQTGWNVTKCHACHAQRHDNLHGNLRKGEVLQLPPKTRRRHRKTRDSRRDKWAQQNEHFVRDFLQFWHFWHVIKQVGMSQSATPATHNDMTTCMETFEKERFCSFPQRHGDATGKPETRDETNGRSKTSISCETSSNFDTFDTLSNRLECHKVPRLPRTTTWQPAWKPSKRRGFAASPKDTATPQENQRLETRQMGAAKRAFRARLPPILTLLTRYQTGWNVTKCHACHAQRHDNLLGNLRKGEVLQLPP